MTAANGLPPRVRLFFSHAKKDGVPIATAAGDWMRARLHGFQAFYDTVDLDLSGDIDLQLQSAIATAMVIVFRTEIFDQRYWCQKEVLWAEKHGRPMLAVDARWQLQHAASVITFDGAPAVRVPDGSFVRIFSVALHEAVRVEIFKLRVTLRKKVIPPSTAVACIPRCPSMVALGHACESLSQSGSAACCIVYPNPSLPAMMGEVIAYFVDKAVPGCRIMSFDEFTLLA
ncbi:MAG TPA: hypothetical protein VGR14_19650 [Verrucomicrobiae bacterium]|nr:hypothetical protein [Verrucomicrobiae bacterium]